MKRILIKLSGEALAGDKQFGFDHQVIVGVAKQLKELVDSGKEVAVVIGGGNFWRGRTSNNMDRTKADQIGMLATVMNAIYVADVCRELGMKVTVMTPFVIGSMTELFSKDKALADFKENKIIFFAGGTGHPFFSTDTGAALRGAEVEVEALLFAKNIDGVYDSDPKKNSAARKFERLSCQEMLRQNLQAIDTTAAALCIDRKLPIIVFDLGIQNSIIDVVNGKQMGTTIYIEEEN